MLVIQDHMGELAIQLARLSEWATLPLEESQLKEEEFRKAMEEKNALFRRPKEQAVTEVRRKLGIDVDGRVQSYGDKDESRSLRKVADFQKHIEKDLHRMTREALRRARKVSREMGLDDRNSENVTKARESYEILRSTFEAVAGREFMG